MELSSVVPGVLVELVVTSPVDVLEVVRSPVELVLPSSPAVVPSVVSASVVPVEEGRVESSPHPEIRAGMATAKIDTSPRSRGRSMGTRIAKSTPPDRPRGAARARDFGRATVICALLHGA
ncbi:MAG: hypothetical protein KC468_04490 [Myxococcales bacterium]|nr:hypothetical protein [Myxococcales bacterium]